MEESTTRSNRRKIGCGCGVTLLLISISVGLIGTILDDLFSLRSNLSYLEFRNSRDSLQIQSADDSWNELALVTSGELEGTLSNRQRKSGAGFRWSTLRVRRPARKLRESAINLACPGEVHLIEVDPQKFDFFPWFERKPDGRFLPRTFRDALGSDSAGDGIRFAINASYYGRDGQPLGWIVRDGREIRSQWKQWSGFFFVKDGQPRFGPRSSLEATPGVLTQATQGYPSVMRDGKVWKYVSENRDRFFNGSELTFRSLAGVGADGRIMLIVSGRGGLLDMAEITEIARLAGVRDATLLDGGRALQYGLAGMGKSRSFHAFNNTVSEKWVPSRLAPEKPPVFLVIRQRED